jgi:hypothetical protein
MIKGNFVVEFYFMVFDVESLVNENLNVSFGF